MEEDILHDCLRFCFVFIFSLLCIVTLCISNSLGTLIKMCLNLVLIGKYLFDAFHI